MTGTSKQPTQPSRQRLDTVRLRACVYHHPGLTAADYAARLGGDRDAVTAALRHMAAVGSVVCRPAGDRTVWEMAA